MIWKERARSALPGARWASAGRAPGWDALFATLAYLALTLVLTWPLARGLSRDVPGDLGDPLLNAWILTWDADHLLSALKGRPSALGEYWHANIYHPHPYALAYSDHLTAEALQILPIYALTKNPLLCYNALFLSTFVLSGLGMFLFARELTGSRTAALIAGLAFAFAPYRIGSIPHVQVLSSVWMPFTLFGFRRFFETSRTRPLAGACAAWIAQNLSCGYYLLFFSPIVVLYLLWEVTQRAMGTGRRRHVNGDPSRLLRLALGVAAVAIATVPFVTPYAKLRELGFAPRSFEEIEHYSGDVFGYFTADPNLLLWGTALQAWPRAENALFPGLAIGTLASVGIAAAWRRARTGSSALRSGRTAHALGIALIVSSLVLGLLLLGWTLRLPFLKITSFDRHLTFVLICAGSLLAVSPRARASGRRWLASPAGILTLLTVFAAAMSFGPQIRARGRLVEDASVYHLFYAFVPGFDGLRVPARFAMIVTLTLAALAAYGAAAIDRLRHGRLVLAAAAALIVLESAAIPLGMNGSDFDYKQAGLAPLPPAVAAGDRTPQVYRFAAQLPQTSAIVEFPFGEVAFETRYMLYSTVHWRRLVNGYSGGAPVEYGLLIETFKDIDRRPDRAWTALHSTGATHAIVHEGAYLDDRGTRVSNWLRAHGARETATFGRDRVFELR